MTALEVAFTSLLTSVVDCLDVPPSYYEKAAARHRSLGDWLCRPASRCAQLDPHVSPQGSFRLGTVNRPLTGDAEYDLDNVTTLQLSKTAITQHQLKELYGLEIKEYATANGMLSPVLEKNRCWRLTYADEARFHLDTLPSLPEDEARVSTMIHAGVRSDLAARAIAITDRRHPQYDQITTAMLSSNPRGFARWFEGKTRPVALSRMRRLVENRAYAAVDAVPAYEWKTPLQRSIQLLKRHRDVMFMDSPEIAPISMIITNLSAQAYRGETDLGDAVSNILESMPSLVRASVPRVPNPADPAEDYADRWRSDPRLERAFWGWHAQAKADVARLRRAIEARTFETAARQSLRVELTVEQVNGVVALAPPPTASSTPAVQIVSAPRPWRHDH